MNEGLKVFVDGLFIIIEMFMRCVISVVVLFILSNEISEHIFLIGIVSIFWILYPIIRFSDEVRLFIKKEKEKEVKKK